MIAGCGDINQTDDTKFTEVTVQTTVEPTALSTISSEPKGSTVNLDDVVPLSRPVSAAAVSVSPDGRLVVAVNPDNNSITLVDAINLVVLTEIPVGATPRTPSILWSISPPDKALIANRCQQRA